MVFYTGGNVNDLGSYDACRADPDLTYGTIQITNKNQQYDYYIGICVPINCTKNDFNNIAVGVKDFLDKSTDNNLYNVKSFLYEANKPDVKTSNQVGVLLFSIIL